MDKTWYDTDGMNRVSNEIRNAVSNFQRDSVAKFFNEMETKIGLSESHATWNGEQAESFMTNVVRPKKTDISNICRNVIAYASNLNSHAKSWDTYEQNK